MLNFEEFCLKVKEEFMNYISADYGTDKGYFVEVKDVEKNGKKFRVLYMNSSDKAIKPPIMPLDRLYESIFVKKYKGDAISSLKEIAASYERNYVKSVAVAHKTAIEGSSLKFDINKVFFALINFEANKEELESNNIPFSVEGDFAVIYRILINQTDEDVKSILINKNVLKEFEDNGYDFEKIKDAAMKNTSKLFPEKLVRISDDAYMLTSEYCCFGSSVLLYESNSVKELSERTGKNVLIFPCSINTCFILLVDEDVVREADIYKDEISQFFMDMDEPVLNTSVIMYSNKEKKLLYGDDVIVEEKVHKRKTAR